MADNGQYQLPINTIIGTSLIYDHNCDANDDKDIIHHKICLIPLKEGILVV